MKVELIFIIFGLVLISLFNESQCKRMKYDLLKPKKTDDADDDDKKSGFTKSIVSINSNIPKFVDNPNVANLIRTILGGVVPLLRPPVLSQICDAISTTGFSFYDAVQLKNAETLKQEEEEKKVAELHEFRKKVETGIQNLGKQLHAETDKIINGVEKSFEKLGNLLSILTDKLIGKLKNFYAAYDLVENLRTTLNYFDQYYEDYNHCLIKIGNCKNKLRKNIVNDLIGPSEFSRSLATFVNNFIDRTDKLRTSTTDDKHGFFEYLLEQKKKNYEEGRDCDMASPQNEIFRFYMYIMIVTSKAYSMVLAAHTIRGLDENTNETSVEEQTRPYIEASRKLNNVLLTISKHAQNTLLQLSTEIRACDLNTNHKEGVTYEKINLEEKVYIGYLYYPVHMPNGSTDYVHTFIADHPKSAEWYHGRKVDKTTKLGKIHDKWVPLHDCQYDKESLTDMYPWKTNYIEYTYDPMDDTELFYNMEIHRPHDSRKYSKEKLSTNHTIQRRIMNGPSDNMNFHQCEHLKPGTPGNVCPLVYRCNVNSSIYPPLKAAQQHLSLLPVTVDDGYVATGIRWRNRKNILYLELQQGLYEDGQVDPSTVTWKPTPEHEISPGKTIMIRDGHGFMLEDGKLPLGYVVTGVQFQWDNQNLIGIKVQGKSFEKNTTVLVEMDLSQYSSVKLDIVGSGFPENAKNNKIMSMSGKHHIFLQRIGSIENDNRAFIPYLDIQSVETKQPAALEGIGIYYAGIEGYGGFIGLRAFGHDYTKIINLDELARFNENINKVYEIAQAIPETEEITNLTKVIK